MWYKLALSANHHHKISELPTEMHVQKMLALVLYVLAFSGVTLCHNDQIEQWRRHTARVTGFKCGPPQPRSMPITDFFKEAFINSVRQILPVSTILHRCESSGCCPINKTCRPVQIEDVTLVFLVMEGLKKTKYFEVVAQNHTNCACDYVWNSPK